MIDDLVTPRRHRALSHVHLARRIPAVAARRQRRPAADRRRASRSAASAPSARAAFAAKAAALRRAPADLLQRFSLTPNEAARHGLKINQDGLRRSAFDLLALPDASIRSLAADLARAWRDRRQNRAAQIEIDAKYAVYLDRQAKDIEAARRDEALAIPRMRSIIARLAGLSSEIRAKLELIRPRRWPKPAESRA